MIKINNIIMITKKITKFVDFFNAELRIKLYMVYTMEKKPLYIR